MTATDLLPHLECVRARGPGKWAARCPAHADRSPSLSVTEGEKGILLKCWAGCDVREITSTLGLSITDLFYDSLSADPHQRRDALQRRQKERAAQQAAHATESRRIDALRQAEYLVRSAEGIPITAWSDAQLDTALDRLGRAYALLESEDGDE